MRGTTNKVCLSSIHEVTLGLSKPVSTKAWIQAMKIILVKFKFGCLVTNRQFAKFS